MYRTAIEALRRAMTHGGRSALAAHTLATWRPHAGTRPEPLRGERADRALERAMSALTAVVAVASAGEILLEHDRADFGNRMMWVPAALGLVGVAVGVAGFVSCRVAKALLPLASLAIIANGVQGTYLHVRGIAQRPGGCAGPRQRGDGVAAAGRLPTPMVGGLDCWARCCGGNTDG